MAKKHIVTLIDDLDGSDADQTVEFALDGNRYEIDLSDANAQRLRDALATYVGNARRAGGSSASRPSRGGRGPARADREQTQVIREWARSHGHTIGQKGRIPAAILEAYNSAH